jgi:hypothetical protein
MANKPGFETIISGPNKVGSTYASSAQSGSPEGGTSYGKGGCSECGAMTPHSHASGKGTKGGGMTRSFGEERYRPVKGR